MLRDVVDGVGPDEAAEHLTHERIRAYAAETPTVYLPTHDPETGARLASAARHSALARKGDRVISFRDSIRIDRPIEQVFAFVSDPIQLPALELGGAGRAAYLRRARSLERDRRPGSTYAMERELPSGQVENGLEVFAREQPTEFGIRTTSGPTPFVYDYQFGFDGEDTIVHLDASVELDGGRRRARAARGARGQARRRRQPHRPQAHARAAAHARCRKSMTTAHRHWVGNRRDRHRSRARDLDRRTRDGPPINVLTREMWVGGCCDVDARDGDVPCGSCQGAEVACSSWSR